MTTSHIATLAMPDHWERRPDETSKAYTAFCVYRDLGAERSMLTAYRQKTGKVQARQASGTWNNWYAKHNWKARTAAYDAHIEALARVEYDKLWVGRRVAVIEADYVQGEKLGKLADKMLAALAEFRGIVCSLKRGKWSEREEWIDGKPVIIRERVDVKTVKPGFSVSVMLRAIKLSSDLMHRAIDAHYATEQITTGPTMADFLRMAELIGDLVARHVSNPSEKQAILDGVKAAMSDGKIQGHSSHIEVVAIDYNTAIAPLAPKETA